jgi:Ca2+-binding RTX toxin-like protein
MLVSGLGTDILEGGAGREVFVFKSVPDSLNDGTFDTITDFTRSEDVIDLRGPENEFGSQVFFIENQAFSGVAGEVRFTTTSNTTVIRADLDGDGSGEFKIVLDGGIGGVNQFDIDPFLSVD